jgi:molybdate-binding protein
MGYVYDNWKGASFLLQVFVGWVGLLCAVLVGLAVVVGVFLYLRSKQREVIRFYKKMGMTEAMYINEMKRRNVDPKQLEAYRKAWQKTKVE